MIVRPLVEDRVSLTATYVATLASALEPFVLKAAAR